MTGQANHIEVPLPVIGPGAVLRAQRSQYGDYFDFRVEVKAPDPSGIRASMGAEVASIAVVSGYACKTRLIVMDGVGADDEPIGAATLLVGNTTLFPPLEQAQALAAFLGIELERQ